ncbi:sensor histidine kinase [Loigolactobacillus backii]|uniref:Sensor histidine kinase n=1 Tax=Loigolactobacillus backii TaxID=375175 RepID=A0A192GZW2_9LACO|nr:sensor histidine kinase [Loigolactobacillus backii]ANK62079.1 two-component sensor histidine kinase [Loigolactobacillus backii]ANK68727.1 two-component sensor histidine kinase [Loigolactobacillus backii]MDA5386732.1 sensor histidine kinase [Loigolactobacillus backii]MDA5389257.1 sensor histidine kinase [Loigolactobacillus backii]
MLESANWVEKNFSETADAIFIFQDDQLLVSNQAAQTLQADYDLSTTYITELMQAVVKQQRTKTDDCFNCVVKGMAKTLVPLTLKSKDGQSFSFFVVYSELDHAKKVYSLTLKSEALMQRMDQLAQQRKLVQYVNRAHEEERKRLSQDLHDSIAQGVYSAIMGVRHLDPATSHTNDAAFNHQTKLIEKQLYETLQEVKGMALDIRPSVLDSFGLESALKALAKRLEENTGIAIMVVSHNADQLNLVEDVQTVLYRIAQESMTNAIKHASANEINLMLVAHDHRISLEIIDDGSGFDVQKHLSFNGHSLGLMNMNERVKALNGVFQINSKIGEGTTVKAEFPIA